MKTVQRAVLRPITYCLEDLSDNISTHSFNFIPWPTMANLDTITIVDIALGLFMGARKTWADKQPSDFLFPSSDLPNVQKSTNVWDFDLQGDRPFRVRYQHLRCSRPCFQAIRRQMLRHSSIPFFEAIDSWVKASSKNGGGEPINVPSVKELKTTMKAALPSLFAPRGPACNGPEVDLSECGLHI